MPTLAGKTITQNGLGLMRLSMPQYRLPDTQTFRLLRHAVSQNITLWNSADFYGHPGSTSLHLLSRYFTAYPEDASKVVLTVKTGLVDRATMRLDCSPANLRKSVDEAMKILDGKKKIDIFGIARVDPDVPIEDSVRALLDLREEGKISGIQITEVSASSIRRAAQVGKIDMVEAEASLWSTEVFENGIAEACAELGIVLVAHSPLGMGMLGGGVRRLKDLEVGSPMRALPRYAADVFDGNRRFVEAVEGVARRKGVTVAQVALSWLKGLSKRPGMPVIVPIAGARSVERIEENAVDVGLTDDDFEEIRLIQRDYPVQGLRTVPQLQAKNEY